MSADKRKRFHRACDLLRRLNGGHWHPGSVSGRGELSLKNPVVRYIVQRDMAKIVRVYHRPSFAGYPLRRTYIDTGYPWAWSDKGGY
jgi:hypothetical protein